MAFPKNQHSRVNRSTTRREYTKPNKQCENKLVNKLHPENNQDLEMYVDPFQSVTSKIIFFETVTAIYFPPQSRGSGPNQYLTCISRKSFVKIAVTFRGLTSKIIFFETREANFPLVLGMKEISDLGTENFILE